MTKTQLQRFRLTRFFCGCLYETPKDTAVFCPAHRDDPKSSFMTGIETINIPLPQGQRPFRRLPANPRGEYAPFPLDNGGHNSLHSTTSVTDGAQNEWTIPEADAVGICCACFIDDSLITETNFAMCECGSDSCSYRWCGSMAGLHAYWRLHVQNKSEEATGTIEQDIFSYGHHNDRPEEVRKVLQAERDDIDTALSQAALQLAIARTSARPYAGRRRNYQPIYLIPWLDRECQNILRGNIKEKQWTTTSLRKKLTRLIVTGTLTPQPPHPTTTPSI